MYSNSTNIACPSHITIKNSRGGFLSQDKSNNLCESHNILLFFFFLPLETNKVTVGEKKLLAVLLMDSSDEIKRQVLFLTDLYILLAKCF